jgi:phosphate transport system permease protein
MATGAGVRGRPPGEAGRLVISGGRSRALGDRIFRGTTAVFAGIILTLLVLITLTLLSDSRAAIARFGLRFITGQVWDPQRDTFGVLPYIYGTVFSSAIALLLAVPIAVGAALFIDEYAPVWLRTPVSFVVELLGAIPSIIYGLWGFFVLGPFMRNTIEKWLKTGLGDIPVVQELVKGNPIGKDVLVAGTILSIMILPTVMSVSREVIASVPDTQREGMLALGATKWETIRSAVIPYARSGIIGASILGLGRALGETMAVTMVIGNNPKVSLSLFAPQYTMAAVIANEFTEAADELYLHALIEIGLVLFVITLIVNSLSRLLIWSMATHSRPVAKPRRAAPVAA